jgi:hypothetical protein
MALSKMRNIGELNEVSKTITTDWFTTNLVPNASMQNGELYKWVFSVSVNTATVVSVLVDTAAGTTVYKFNAGTALVADTLYTMEILISKAVTGVNVQHATTTQNVNCVVGEIREFDSVANVSTP